METCPCGSPDYETCCGPLHRGERNAATAEELMRSRYSAFAKQDPFYLARTWHPRTRPDDVSADPSLAWTGLSIVSSTEDTVDFVARYTDASGAGELREHSRFARRGGRWVYVDGDVN
ncbi:MAG: YchJ family protein [Microbacterium gubbeenense]|uniref:YchJ family protein n=1 Tax=Microbacterium gubbeenense TaxID=159896 RepID=UPI003F9CA92F